MGQSIPLSKSFHCPAKQWPHWKKNPGNAMELGWLLHIFFPLNKLNKSKYKQPRVFSSESIVFSLPLGFYFFFKKKSSDLFTSVQKVCSLEAIQEIAIICSHRFRETQMCGCNFTVSTFTFLSLCSCSFKKFRWSLLSLVLCFIFFRMYASAKTIGSNQLYICNALRDMAQMGNWSDSFTICHKRCYGHSVCRRICGALTKSGVHGLTLDWCWNANTFLTVFECFPPSINHSKTCLYNRLAFRATATLVGLDISSLRASFSLSRPSSMTTPPLPFYWACFPR